MKIAIANHGLYPLTLGGMEKHTWGLAKSLKTLGHEVHVLIPEPKRDLDVSFGLHFLKWPRSPHFLISNYFFSKQVGQWLDENRPDVCLAQGFNAWAYLKNKNIPVVYHPHGLEMFGAHSSTLEKIKYTPLKKLVHYHTRHADCTVSLGGGMTRILINAVGMEPEKITEIPNAIFTKDYAPQTKQPHSFLWVGRLAFNKGIDLLEKTLELIPYESFKLTLVGSGPERERVEKVVRKDARVTWLEKADDPMLKNLYATHETLVFSSRFEGMPTVILEALASGCNVIATNIGCVSEVLTHAPENMCDVSSEALARKIKSQLKAGPIKTSDIENNISQAKKFDWERVAQKFTGLFEKLK